MHVRPARTDDAARIDALSREAFVAAYAGPLDDHTLLDRVRDPDRPGTIRDRLDAVVDDDRVTYLVAERGSGAEASEIVGFGQLLTRDAGSNRSTPAVSKPVAWPTRRQSTRDPGRDEH